MEKECTLASKIWQKMFSWNILYHLWSQIRLHKWEYDTWALRDYKDDEVYDLTLRPMSDLMRISLLFVVLDFNERSRFLTEKL